MIEQAEFARRVDLMDELDTFLFTDETETERLIANIAKIKIEKVLDEVRQWKEFASKNG